MCATPKKALIWGAAYVLLAATLIGCSSTNLGEVQAPRLSVTEPITYSSLIAALRSLGIRAEPAGGVDQPFFSVQANVLRINGEDVQVFDYSDAAAANAEATLVSPDGTSIGTSNLHWVSPPHFYKRGKIVALYLGENIRVLRALETVLGEQFAGK